MHPAFIAWWLLQKKNLALLKIKNEKERDLKFKEWRKEASAVSRAFNQALSQVKDPVGREIWLRVERGLDTEGPMTVPAVSPGEEGKLYPENPESSLMFRQLIFWKYGITFRELIWQLDINHDPDAHRMLMAVHRDYWRLLTGGRFEDLKLKFSSHFGIIVQGLDFGVARLTAEELAECLDEICPCGQKHSPEYLKKLRSRIKQACNRYKSHPPS